MDTHETYVSLEVAKLLKQAGFDWKCYYAFDSFNGREQKTPYLNNWNENIEGNLYCSRPTLSVAQKWLIENYRVFIEVQARPLCDLRFAFILVQPCGDVPITDYNSDDNEYDTYEEALEAGIKKCLEEYSITDKCSEE